ncbi:protein FAR1-RELATED SEQUENCE 5-like [Primulina tabacum]|uniref:protein FAR1-RELATED SEQUENCE 5-like n=1 Tax=Primulina tabacum TaxID=48773 RepID=UPI003F599BAC
MDVTFVDSKYKVNEFIEEHNHPLHLQETVHMLSSQRKITEVQPYEIDLVEDVGLKQKSNFQLMSKHAGGIDGLGYTMLDAKNYIRSIRQISMMDVEEQITNVFWADARMLFDYEYFGDVAQHLRYLMHVFKQLEAQFDHPHHSLEAMDFNRDISNNALE